MNITRFCYVSVCLFVSVSLRAQVVISMPENGVTVSSPVAVSAVLSGAQLSTMTVYNDGVSVYTGKNISSISKSLNLSSGFHTLKVTATEANGTLVSASTSITVTPPEPVASTNVGTEIGSDMMGKNEGNPEGVPLSYAWANGPAIEMGNNSTGWKAMTAWGVVYVAAQGNLATNTRVNIRNVQAYLLQKSSGKWLLLQNTSIPAGAAYLEDFTTTVNVPGDVRNEPDGTISVTAGSGYNYHFYPSVRGSITPSDIGGIVTIFQARLILGDPTKPDDRNIAAYLAGAGGDYYPGLTGTWPGTLAYNPGIATGKEKYVKTFWRFYAMSTVSAATLASNPPPVDLTGILR